MVWLDEVVLLIRGTPASFMVVWVIDFMVAGIIDFMIWVNRVKRLVTPTSWFRLGLGRRWQRFVASTTRLASLASITTAVATLATLAAVSVTIITSMFTISISISTTLSTLSTLAAVVHRFRHGLRLRLWIRSRLILPVSNGIIWLRLRLRSGWRRWLWHWLVVASTLTSLASVSVTTGLASISVSTTLATLAIWFRLRVVWLRFRHRLRLGVASIYNYRFRLRRRWCRWLRLRARARVISSTLASLARLATVVPVSAISVSISTLARLAIVVLRFRHGFWLRLRCRLRVRDGWFRTGVGVWVVWFWVMWIRDDINRLDGTIIYLHWLRRWWWWHRFVTSTTRLASLASIPTSSLARLATVSVAISVIILYK
jgi:hypothetical protein